MSRKYLYVEFVDIYSTYMDAIHLNVATPEKRRVAKIALTNEQIQQLAPREVGKDGGKPFTNLVRG